MKILFAPCHYIFGPNSGSESSWSFEIADRISTKYPECLVITGFQKDKFNEKSRQNSDKKLQNSNKENYEIIELQPDKSVVDMSLQNALLFNWKYFVKTRELLKNEKLENSNQSKNSTKFDTKFQIIHHCLPFAIGSTYNLAALLGFFSDKKFVIGPLQTGLNYRDADIDPRNFRSSNSNNSKSKFNLTTFFTGFLAQIVKPILAFLSHQTLLKADKIIAINKATFDLLVSKNIPESKIQIINPGLDLGKFKFLPKIQNETYLESQFLTQTQNPNQNLTQNLENQRIIETQNIEFDKEKTTQNSEKIEKVEIELEDNLENKIGIKDQNERENKQENEVFEILSVGYLLERKGIDLLIKAVKILKTDLENERNKQIDREISNLDSNSNQILDNNLHLQKNNLETNSQNNPTNSSSLSSNSHYLESNSQNNSEQNLEEKIKSLDKNVNKVNSTIPKIHLNILGDGPQTENLKKLVLELDLEQNVTFVGFVDNSKVAKFYQKADVFVSMSKAESWGQMYLEAMACGLAIITTQNIGSNEIINSQTGILVPQLGVDELVQNLKFLIQNPAKKLQIATNARRELEQKYDWNKIIVQYEELYKNLLAN